MGGLRALLVACVLGVGSVPVSAADETVAVPSLTLSDSAFLRGDASAATPVTLSGVLSGLDGAAPAPVVILLHGTNGPRGGAAGAWRRTLNGLGIATFRLDSYSGRGLAQASDDQGAFGQFTQTYDAFRAADVLAADPRIDGSRIVLMGFSRGGNAALFSALRRFEESFGPERARIVGHIAFYPACNFALERGLEATAAPIRVFHGSEDDWTLAATCADHVARLQAAGVDAAMTAFPGARHAFDDPSVPSLFADPESQSSRDCMRTEVDGVLVNAATGAPFSYADACVAYGPSAQYNDAAATAAQAAVADLLAEWFGPE